MHELSIANNIIEEVSKAAKKKSLKISKVFLSVGPFAGVMEESLLFCYGEAIKDTILEDSKLIIEKVPVKVICRDCKKKNAVFAKDILSIRCPVCKSINFRIMENSGTELLIKSIEVENETEDHRDKKKCSK